MLEYKDPERHNVVVRVPQRRRYKRNCHILRKVNEFRGVKEWE